MKNNSIGTYKGKPVTAKELNKINRNEDEINKINALFQAKAELRTSQNKNRMNEIQINALQYSNITLSIISVVLVATIIYLLLR